MKSFRSFQSIVVLLLVVVFGLSGCAIGPPLPTAQELPPANVNFRMTEMDRTVYLRTTCNLPFQVPLDYTGKWLADRGFEPASRTSTADLLVDVTISPMSVRNVQKEQAVAGAVVADILLGALVGGIVGGGRGAAIGAAAGTGAGATTAAAVDTTDVMVVIDVKFNSVNAGPGTATANINISNIAELNIPGYIDNEVIKILERTM